MVLRGEGKKEKKLLKRPCRLRSRKDNLGLGRSERNLLSFGNNAVPNVGIARKKRRNGALGRGQEKWGDQHDCLEGYHSIKGKVGGGQRLAVHCSFRKSSANSSGRGGGEKLARLQAKGGK